MLLTVIAFIATLGILITFHELGHYAVARWCGVRILRFSVGFGRVLLRGTADSAASKELAGRLAINTRGVASVDNQLAVSPLKPSAVQSAMASAHNSGQALADSWITAKVKSTLLYSSNVSGSDITVNTNQGIVTLNGKLKSGAERALAIELAQNVRGVRSVEAEALRF